MHTRGLSQDCIKEWSSVATTCPLCKAEFTSIDVQRDMAPGAVVLNVVPVEPVPEQTDDHSDEDGAAAVAGCTCVACGGDEDEDQLLMCDGCDAGFHTCVCRMPCAPNTTRHAGA